MRLARWRRLSLVYRKSKGRRDCSRAAFGPAARRRWVINHYSHFRRCAQAKSLFLPAENRQNVEEDLTPELIGGVQIHYAGRIEDVLAVALPLLKARADAQSAASPELVKSVSAAA